MEKQQVKAAPPSTPSGKLKDHELSEFLAKVAAAKAEGTEWVETSPEVIAHFNPRGLGGAKHFCFQGVLVCAHGQSEAIQKDMDTPLSVKLHGPDEGISSYKA